MKNHSKFKKALFASIVAGTIGFSNIPFTYASNVEHSAIHEKGISLEKSIDYLSLANLKIPVSDAINNTGKFMYENIKPGFGTTAGEWTALGLARAEYPVDSQYFEDYYEKVCKVVSDKKGSLHNAKYTEYSRVIVALTSIGKDVTNVAGYDMTKPLSNYTKVIYQGINGPIWALIALDSNNYEMRTADEGVKQATRDNLIEYILSQEITQADGTLGGWALSGKVPDPDITGMALQALANYQNHTITAEGASQLKGSKFQEGETIDVQPYIDRAVSVLSKLQQENGGYTSWGTENSESIVQVVVALTALGIDPSTDERFIKGNGNWLLSALSEYYVDGGGFKHILNGSRDGMATDQAMYGLVAYDRFKKGKTNLYDMTDVFIDKEAEKGEVVLGAPKKISGKKGTTFDITLESGGWNTGQYKLLDGIISLPEGIDITGITASNNITGGKVKYGVEDNKLRLVYTNTDLNNIDFSSNDMMTVHCQLNKDITNDKLEFILNEMNLKSSSTESTLLKVDNALVNISIGEDSTQPDPNPETAEVKELYVGDGTELIDKDKKAVAVSFLNISENTDIKFGNTQLYYSKEFSDKLSNTTYIAIVDKSMTNEQLKDISQYAFDKNKAAESITLADTNSDNTVNAQDALNSLSTWLRKTDTTPNDKDILVMNVTGDSKLDTSDTLGIIENYINNQEYGVLQK